LSQSCGKRYHLVKNIANSVSRFAVYTHRCKSWDCPGCRRRKAARVSAAIDRVFAGRSFYFLTITHDRSRSLEETWRETGTKWNELITYARKNNPKFSYIRILEPHKKEPYPHLHVLVSIDVFSKAFFLYSKTLGFGQQQQQTKISSERAKQYVTKYLGKAWPDNGGAEIRKMVRTRVLSTSRDFGALFFKKSSGETLAKFLSAPEASARLTNESRREVDKGALLRDFEVDDYSLFADYGNDEISVDFGMVYSIVINKDTVFGQVILYTRDACKKEVLNI
jgi:hypothetical protein